MAAIHRSGKVALALAAVIMRAGWLHAADEAAMPTPNPHIEELRKAAMAEPDRAKQEELWQQTAEEEYADDQRRAALLHELWKQETDPEKRQDLGEELSTLGVRISNHLTGGNYDAPADLVIEVATNGEYAQKEIKVPEAAQAVPLQEVRTLEAESSDANIAWVVRRMTENRAEVWLPHHGWLFDDKGKLIAEAKPPRRDGSGRQWYGAFLPDGRWVTTDLFAEDKTLTFFTSSGKWLKEIAADKLVPAKPDNDRWSPGTISWCRCTKRGDAFVLRVGQNGGRGDAWVNWSGQHHELSAKESPWQLCYPRDLEPKGTYTYLSVPDDRGRITMTREEPGHGPEVGFPVYEAGKVRVRVPEGQTFGFWPQSDNVYVVVEHQNTTSDEAGGLHTAPTTYQTWFYNADGTFAGWIAARRIADSASRDGMLFLDADQRLITLGGDYHVIEARQFRSTQNETGELVKLFPDLRLGFFQRDNQLILASW